MNKYEAINDFLYKKIAENALKFASKAAVIDSNGNSATYGEVFFAYDSMRKFFSNSNIEPMNRFALVSDDAVAIALLQPPVLENAVIAHMDKKIPVDKIGYYLKLLKHDYILTDNPEDIICRTAIEMGLGIVLFERTKDSDRIRFSVSLYKKPDNKAVNMIGKNPDQILVGTTSGTTAVPKVVPIDYNIMINGIKRNFQLYDLTADDVFLNITPMTRNISINSIIGAFYLGSTIIATNGFNHLKCINMFRDYDITTFTATPVVYESFLKYLDNTKTKLRISGLRYARSTGAPLSEVLRRKIEKIFKTEAVQTYGMTETKAIACTRKAPFGYKEGSSGVVGDLDIKIYDGEILVRGNTVFAGYENDDIDNSKYFTDGWFHTGDTGFVDKDGYLFITGRIKEMINRGGEKISPYEVENAIYKTGGIRETAVFPYPGESGEEAGAAVVIDEGVVITLETLRNALSKTIPTFKMPTKLFVVPAIPDGKGGKLERKRLYNQLLESYPDCVEDDISVKSIKQSSISKIENTVLKIWKKVLGRKVDVEKNFSDLGGDSLNAGVILSEIESRLGVLIPVNLLMDGGTVRKIAAYISKAESLGQTLKFIVPIKTEGSGKLLICIHPRKGDAETYNLMARDIRKQTPVYGLRFNLNGHKWKHPATFEQISKVYAEEIMRFDPDGPYYLCGFCYGGVLAYSIAAEIVTRGGEVALLAMADSPLMKKGKRRNSKGNRITGMIKRAVKTNIKTLKHISLKEFPLFIWKRVKGFIGYFNDMLHKNLYSKGVQKNSYSLMKAGGGRGLLNHAFTRYNPGFYKGRITYIFASASGKSNTDKYEFWQDKAEDFELVVMDCDHDDLFRKQKAGELAENLNLILGRNFD